MQGGHLGCIAAQDERKSLCHGLAREVVLSGAKAAHDDEDVSAREGGADGADKVFAAVADDGFEGDGHANFVEFFGQVKGVGVLAEGGKHLGADSNDLGFHKGSFQLLASSS